jgi:putative SOS response-associated peptidase YedK
MFPMCGRYRLSRRKQIIEEYFGSAPWDEDWRPRFNIAPTQAVPVIRQHPKESVRQISTMCWGLIPHWANNSFHRDEHDKCEVGDSRHKACVPRSP